MNLETTAARLKTGYLAQVMDEDTNKIVWQSTKVYKTYDKAVITAQRKINSAVEHLFSD